MKQSRHINPDAEAGGRSTDYELIARAQAGDTAARNVLVLRHDSFVRMMVRRAITGRMSTRRREEIVEEHYADGVIAMCKAIEYFDLSRGFNLLTYAGWIIKREVWRRRNADSTVSRPQSPPSAKSADPNTRARWFAAYRARRLHRKRGGGDIDPAAVCGRAFTGDFVPGLIARMDQRADVGRVLEAIDRLPPRQRTFVHEMVVGGLSQFTIAREHGVARQTVTRHTLLGVAAVRAEIESKKLIASAP